MLDGKFYSYHIIKIGGVIVLGEHIEFFFDVKDETIFTNYIYHNNYVIMDDKANILSEKDIISSNEMSVFIAFSGSRIEKREIFIDQITSEVIQYSRCMNWSDSVLNCGRLWVTYKYWNVLKENITKSNQLNQTYNNLTKWIKKNTRVSVCKHYYIGEQAYNLYSNNKWRMAAGPKSFIEFRF